MENDAKQKIKCQLREKRAGSFKSESIGFMFHGMSLMSHCVSCCLSFHRCARALTHISYHLYFESVAL